MKKEGNKVKKQRNKEKQNVIFLTTKKSAQFCIRNKQSNF